MNSALTRFRVLAWVVGVLLLALSLVAMPLKYLAGEPSLVEGIGPIHGFLYFVYLVVTLDLAVRQRWGVSYTVLILLAGTVPFLSFLAERRATQRVREAGSPAAEPAGSAG